MNDGREYTIEHTDEAVVSDISAYVLYRGDDGKLRRVVLPLVTMSAVHPLSDTLFCLSWTLSFEGVLEFSTTLKETFDVEAEEFHA